MEEARKAQHGVALQNCTFKRSHDNDNLKVYVNKKASIVQLPKKFKIDEKLIPVEVASLAALKTMEDLKDAVEHQCICVSGKVQSVSAQEQVVVKATGKRLIKREAVLADGTAACRFVLWEARSDEVEGRYQLQIGKCCCQVV